MPRSTSPGRLRGTKVLIVAMAVMLVATLVGTIAPTSASAAGTVLFQNLFNDRTVDGTGSVTVPSPASGTNVACLTASGNTVTPPLLSCSGSVDVQGSGKLRMTNSTTNQVGGVFGQNSFPTSNGLDVTFNSYQWGGGSADGIAFMLAAVDPANPVAPTTMGPSGGSLGYSPAGSVKGMTNAYLGVGLDVFGNFSANGFSGTGCTNPANISVQAPGAVVVRGPGTGFVGYCGLTSTYDGTVGSKVVLRATTRAASVVPVQVLINPTAAAFTSDTGVTVDPGTYKVVVKPVGTATKTLTGVLPTVSSTLYPSTSWLNASGVPKQLAFGFVGSTGSVTDVHEASDVKVLTFNPVPQLSADSTSWSATTSQPGDPVTYQVVSSVQAGANVSSSISMTQTVPTGVVPVGAYGTGWVCQAPIGKTITCTTTATSFTNGTTLPTVTVVAIVTAANVASTTIQSSSLSRASSADANPGSDSVTTLGTLPTTPSGLTATPAIGVLAGGGAVTVTGSNITAATAIEIGTTPEQQAGTPVTLLPCPGAAAAGCFTVSGSSLVISSMPARASSATVTVTVVTAGIAAAAAYVYADKPASPATPTATAGITSAVLSWVAPASNGSPITGYIVTPWLGGVAQTPVSFDASTTTRTFTGLTPGGSYAYTVAAVNAYGTSTASAKSVAVVPYTLPSAPSITAASAADSGATLTWSAPSNGGSAITGYVVTPYIAGVAQTAQTFASSATTQSVTGLTPGTTYTFRVAAQNLAGTGPQSALSAAVTPNSSPSLTFSAPPAGEVGVAYSRQLTVNDGTSPFTWSVSSGSLPAGMVLGSSTGLLGGTPTSSGSFTFVVRVVDASGQSATRSVTLDIAAAPSLTFAPAAGEVGVAYSQQPTLMGGTGPFTWSISAGSLPPGVTISSTTGLVSGTPTSAGSFSVTIATTDGFSQVATKTVTIVVVARPAFSPTPPPAGQVGVAYSSSLDVTGGALPLTWSVSVGTLPPGMSLGSGTGALTGTPTTAGTSSFTASVVDANGQTATKAVTLVIAAGPLVIVKTANVSSSAAGGTVSYTISISNTGATVWNGATLTDALTGVLDDATYNADATATAGTLTYTASRLGWTGNVAAGGSVVVAYSVRVNNPDLGNRILANTVASSTLGTNCASGSTDVRCSASVTVAGLSIVKTADVATTTPGGTVHLTIVATNTGQTAYAPASLTDNLAGMLDDGTYTGDAAATSGSLSFSSPSLTWTGALPVGGSVTITYSVVVANPDIGDRSLTGTVVSATAGSPCPSGGPAASCTATVQVLVPALVIAATANVTTTTPGSVVGYTVTLTNTGQTPYVGASVGYSLGGVLDDASYNGDVSATAGTVSFDGVHTLVWTGNLAVGASVTVTASVTVNDPDAGDLVLTGVATSSAPGSSCPANSSSPACTSTVAVRVPHLALSTSADRSSTTPGSVVHYTVTVTNSGQTAYTGAAFADSLSGLLDDATYAGDAAATSGTVSVSGSTLSWTGNLPVGATSSITFSVVVRDPDPGDRTLISRISSTTPGNSCPAAGTDPACTSSIAVLVPGLSVVSSVDSSTTTPGSVVHYSVTVTNTGQTTYHGLPVTLDLAGALDDASYNYDATISTGNLVTNLDGTVDWVLDLAPGASASGSVSFTVLDPPTGNRSILITAVSDVPGSTCPTGSPVSACNATVAVLVPGLTFTKTASTVTVSPGGTVSYTITAVNTGETGYPSASFTDDLSAVLTDAIYGGDATASTGSVSYEAPALTWTGALSPGATATITYTATVRDPDPGDKQLVNTVVSSAVGSNCAVGSTDSRCSSAVAVLVPGLTVGTLAGVATTTPGATVGHTLTVTNSGATALTGASVSDALAGVLDDATYGGDGAATTGTVAMVGSTLTWTGNLAVGASATITFSVVVHAADVGDDLLTDVVTSSAYGNNCASGSADPRCTSTVPVARLVLAQVAAETTTTPGSIIHLSQTFTNTGQVPYVGISIVSPRADTSDDTIPTGDQVASSGTLVRTSTAVTWTGDIPVGGVVTSTRTLTVQNPDPGNKIITATLQSSAPGNNCPTGTTDPSCTFLITVLLPELTVVKTANTTATVPGGTVGYTITVHDTGQTPYTGATVSDSLAGVLDDATYNGDATASGGTVSYSSPTLSWVGDLAVGATVTLTYTVTVHTVETGDKTMVNPVVSTAVGSTCPPASGSAACRSTVVVLTPSLTIVKSADLANATLGSTVTYSILVRNSGQTSYASAAISDPLSGVLDDASYNGDASANRGTVSYASGVLSWSGSLSPGVSATITYTVTITNPASGDGSMVDTVSSANTNNNCPSGAGDSRCTVTVAVTNAVTLTFTKTADRAAAAPGGVVQYTDTIVNSSVLPVVAANLTDPLAGILDDATYNGDAAASGGTVTYTAPDLQWSGTVPALSTITITYSVTVDAVATGDQILGGTISSTSLLTSDNCTSGSTDPRCTNTVTVASLVIQQHYTETSTTAGSLVHLSATFTNAGQTPYTGVTISSPSADTVDDAIPTGDQVASSGTLVLSASAITWTGNIAVGAVVTVTGTLTVKNPDTGNKTLTGTLVSASLGNNCPAGGTDPRCTASLGVLLPGLTLTKSADVATVLPGGTVTYTVTIQNTGQTPYVGATATDTLAGILDDAGYGQDASATSGTVSYSSPVLTWTGDLAVGAIATVTYSATADSPAVGDKTMLNPVTSSAVGSTCPPASGSSACRSTVTVLTPALVITSTADVASTVPGATVAYTVSATNTGQTDYAAASVSLPLADVVDDAHYGSSSATSGTISLSGSTLTWSGALAIGATVTVSYTVTVDDPVSGDFRLDQTVSSDTPGSTCPTAGTDPRCSTSIPVASLVIVNGSDVTTAQPTSVVRNTVTFTNTGQVPYVGISISDSFVGSLDDATYNGDAGGTSGSLLLVPASGRVVWTGDVPVGATVTVTGSLTVNNPDLGNRAMTTRVSTSAIASTCPVGNTVASCASNVVVLTPALTITKTADSATAGPGSTITYTVTVTDSGETAYVGASVQDALTGVLDDATYGADAAATTGSMSYTAPMLTWTGNLAVGQSAVVTYTVQVGDPDLGDKAVVNAVTSDAIGSTCPTGGSDPSCSSSVDVRVPVLEIAISADRATTVPGATVGYTVTVHNAGQTDYQGATVTAGLAAVLDDATYASDGSATIGTVAYTSPDLTWTGDLGVGATTVITYGVTVADPDSGDHVLSTAVHSSAAGSTCSSAAPCTNDVTVLVPGLSVSTSGDVASTTPGSHVTFTTTITNTGETAYPSAALGSGLGGLLDDAGIEGAVSSSSGVATYTAPDLSWTGSLPIGASVTISYTVLVADPDAGDHQLAATVVVPAAGSPCADGSTDPACTATVAVLTPSLTLAVTAGVASTTPGSVVGYTIVISNTGQTAYHGAIVDDSLENLLADSDYYGDATATSGSVSYAAPTLTWTGDLAVGASASVTYSISVHDPDTGDKLMTTTVSSSEAGSTCPVASGSPACVAAVRVLVPALDVTKVADTTSVTAGGTVQYTITLVNDGQTDYLPAVFSDPLTGVLDDADYHVDATATSGTVSYAAPTLAWTGALAVGETATITYSVGVRFPADGDRTLVNSVRSSSPGADCADGSAPACISSVTVLVPQLDVAKSASTSEVVAGGSLQYTIVARNSGEADYPSATLVDSLSGVLDDGTYPADATASSGTVTFAGGTLTWTGALAKEATVIISYSIDVDLTETGDGVMANRVVSATVGSNCPEDGADPSCSTSTLVAARSITLTGLTPSFTLSGTSHSTVTADGAVTMTVTTNSFGGYFVTVQAAGDSLTGADPGNHDVIPIEDLGVREAGTSTFHPMSSTQPTIVHQQATPSGPSGDAVSTDYQIQVPFVAPDTYSGTLEYIATAQ